MNPPAPSPYNVILPQVRRSPLVVEVPHAGLQVDAQAAATLIAPTRCLGRDADLHVDWLCRRVPETGATLLTATQSRYVCDLNRGPMDFDARAAEGGPLSDAPHGLFWRRTTEGQDALRRPLPRNEVERRMRLYYEPYHRRLQELLHSTQEEFGYAILLCAHSMPSSGRIGHLDPSSVRADIVPGSQGRTSAASEVIDLPATLALTRGWSVRHDEPYRGGFTTTFYGRPKDRVHAVQVELNRALYLDEDGLTLQHEGAQAVTEYLTEVCAHLARLPADRL